MRQRGVRLRRDKTGDAMDQASWRSSFLDDLGRHFFVENWGSAQRKKRVEKNSRPVETDAAVEIHKERGFPPRLEKASPTTLGFFTVPTGPTIIINSKLLTRPSSGVTYDSRKYFKNILRAPGLRYVLNASPYGRRRTTLRPEPRS